MKCFFLKSLSFIVFYYLSGRLNVLANVTRKPLEELFCQFDPNLEPSDVSVSKESTELFETLFFLIYHINKKEEHKSYIGVSFLNITLLFPY